MKSVAVLTLVIIGVSGQLASHFRFRSTAAAGSADDGTRPSCDGLRPDQDDSPLPARSRSGGTIEITANDKSDSASIASIRSHLEHIRGAFAAGNFSMPMFIHGTEPPGADVLAKRRDALVYRVEEIPAGGRLIITTKDTEALNALHAFLKFQITEHKTGDPMVPK